VSARASFCSTSRWPGWGPFETERTLRLLSSLRADHAILLVEHNVDAVFRIADRIT